MRILGKDNGKHVVERSDGEREHLTDAQLEKELDGMGKARASVTGLPPEFAPPAPKNRSAGVKVIGRDNGLNVIEVDGERKHVNDAELLLIKGGKAVTNALSGPPERKDEQTPDQAKAQAEAAEKARLEAEAKAKEEAEAKAQAEAAEKARLEAEAKAKSGAK